MKLLPTLLVSLVTIALGFLAAMQQTRGNLDFIFGSPPLERGENLYKFNPADVGRIEILNSDGTNGEIVRTDNAWMLKKPWQDFADARTVRSLIDFAARLQIEDVIDRDEVDDFADYGLKKDRIEVRLFNRSGKPLCEFRMGRYTSWRSFDPTFKSENPTQKAPSFPTLIIQPTEDSLDDHLYVCSDFANPALRTVLMRDLFSGGLRLFRDHRLFYHSPTLANRITLKEKNSEITLTRKDLEKESEWKIEKPYELATSPRALKQLTNGLAAIQAGAVVDEDSFSLPPPLPENIAFSISVEYAATDQKTVPPVTAMFYPPANDEAKVVPVLITDGVTQKRSAVLLVPRGPGSLLATLPRDVNSLRSRTMTAMNVRQVEAVTLRDFTGRSVNLTLEMDPHERAARWHANVLREDGPDQTTVYYRGPANSQQVFDFFETLFKNEIRNFTNDASTSPENYGLDRPIRRITITPTDGEPVTYIIGEKPRPKFYARRLPRGRVIEISREAYDAGLKGEPHPELTVVAQPSTDTNIAPGGLEFFGLDRPKTTKVGDITLDLGTANARLFFANQLDANGNHTPHVVEIGPGEIPQMPLAAFHWRGERLWNINRFEIKGLIIKKRGEPALELDYDFYNPSPWTATRGPKDVTSLLNTNKADKLIKKITDIEVQKWIGPVAENAAARLLDPSLSISILIEEMSEEGLKTGNTRKELRFSEVVDSPANRFYFGKAGSQPSYFLLDEATHQRLSVDLLKN